MSQAELEDERAFLLRSIEDLDRERAAGDLSGPDHVALRDRYVSRAAQVLRALGNDPGPVSDTPAEPTGPPQARPRRSRRAMLVAGGIALLVAVSGVVVFTQTGTRLPGNTASGSVTVGRADQLRRTLAQAETLEASGDATGALRLYRQVLAQNGSQVEALAESGWLEFEAGVRARDGAVIAHAQQLEQRAVHAEPGAYAPHLYLGSMLLAENDVVGAQQQYQLFVADHPPAAQLRAAAPFIDRAFAASGKPPPPLPDVASAGR